MPAASGRRKRGIEERWAFVRDVATTTIGAVMLLTETIASVAFAVPVQTALVVIGASLLGVPVASAAQKWLGGSDR